MRGKINNNYNVMSEFSLTCFSNNNKRKIEKYVNTEHSILLTINNQIELNLLCSPNEVKEFIIGYLYNEEFINQYDEIQEIYINNDYSYARVTLSDTKKDLPSKKTRTSGFGNGITFLDNNKLRIFDDSTKIEGKGIFEIARKREEIQSIYNLSGGIHSSALCSEKEILVFSEDIGRHNTLDKVAGISLLGGIDTSEKLLFTSGRISSDMVKKCNRLNIPIVISLSAVTEKSIKIAKKTNMTLIGYCKNEKFYIYTNDYRIIENNSH